MPLIMYVNYWYDHVDDVNNQLFIDKDGRTALHVACMNEENEVIDYFVEKTTMNLNTIDNVIQ